MLLVSRIALECVGGTALVVLFGVGIVKGTKAVVCAIKGAPEPSPAKVFTDTAGASVSA